MVFVALASSVLPFPSAIPAAATATLFLSHVLIGPLKARYGIIKRVWVDQILHIAVLFGLLLLDWY